MKNKGNNTGTQAPQVNKNRQAPDVRDNLDSRKNEEQETRGDDITHNRKAHHNKQQKPR